MGQPVYTDKKMRMFSHWKEFKELKRKDNQGERKGRQVEGTGKANSILLFPAICNDVTHLKFRLKLICWHRIWNPLQANCVHQYISYILYQLSEIPTIEGSLEACNNYVTPHFLMSLWAALFNLILLVPAALELEYYMH